MKKTIVIITVVVVVAVAVFAGFNTTIKDLFPWYNVDMKKGFKENIEKATLDNSDFRRVLYTGKHSQIVLMTLLPKEEIGLEIHSYNDQFFRFEKGQGQVLIDNTTYDVGDGDAVMVPAGAQHNIINVSSTEPLKFYTIYSPAHHKDKIVGRTKQEAEQNDVDFDGITTE